MTMTASENSLNELPDGDLYSENFIRWCCAAINEIFYYACNVSHKNDQEQV